MAFRFAGHRTDDAVFELLRCVIWRAQYGAQIHRVLIAQAQQQASLGGDAHAVAEVAEIVAVR